MNAQSLSGMLRAQELLLVSMIRSLPPDARTTLVDLYAEQLAFAEQAGFEGHGDRATHDHPLLMKFDLPRAAIGARVGGRKALRQSKGVEPRVAARPGER